MITRIIILQAALAFSALVFSCAVLLARSLRVAA
jgi:hypothetical protein